MSFLKQYNYKPRSNSQSSSGVAESAPKEEQPRKSVDTSGPALSDAIAGRRRSSVDQKYAGLNKQKRSSMDDKRTGWADQKPGQQGILGGMWTSFTKGT